MASFRDSQCGLRSPEAGRLVNHVLFLRRHLTAATALGLFAFTFLVYYLTGKGGATRSDYFVPLADGFLHGRLSVVHPRPVLLDELIAGRHRALYVIYPPMPAILLLPYVALWGLKANQTLAAVFFGSLNVSLFFILMRRLTLTPSLQLWMACLFAFGTIHWYLASIGSAWYIAHVVSFLFLTLAIYATISKKPPFLIGLLVGAAYWTRLPTILSLPFFVIMLAERWLPQSSTSPRLRRIRLKPLVQLGTGIGIFVGADLLYNYARFRTPRDIAYSTQASHEPKLYPSGLFDISYIPHHLWILFLKPPVFTEHAPYVKPSLLGLSILITTPAVVYSLGAIRSRLSIACWSAIVPVALLNFTHGGTGWQEFGYRFAMDFYPFLLVLTALGIRDRSDPRGRAPRMAKALIGLSILVNVWGVLWINKFGWASDVILH